MAHWRRDWQTTLVPRVTGKFGLGVENEAGQSLTEFCQENSVTKQTLFPKKPRDKPTHGHNQIVNTKLRLIVFFAANDGESLYSQQKQDLELTVAQIMGSLLQISGLNRRKQGKPLVYSGIT